ncbi:MAG: LuxR C-terminal-related transcriptional regulator [Gordonibacter sp.]|nr:LuxR C-terminal-related transcriptional regulator [Gordonibacter sp.]
MSKHQADNSSRPEKHAQQAAHYAAQHCDTLGDIPDEIQEPLHRDGLTLDYLISVLGFGLCRAWIVLCLSAPIISPSATTSNWLYLVFGALSALAISFVVRHLRTTIEQLRCALYRAALGTIIASGILIPASYLLRVDLLLVTGFIVGGVGAGILQVLWGDRFAQRRMRFTALASPAAAIVTGLVIALLTDGTSIIGFAVIPLASLGLLIFEADRTGVPAKTLFCSYPLENQAPEELTDSQENIREASAQDELSKAPEDTTEARTHRGMALGVGKLMFSIMTFSFLCRLFDAIPTSDSLFAFLGGSAIFALVLVGTVFLLIVALLRDRFDVTLTYRLSLPLMVAGFVAIALFFDSHAALSLVLINIGYEFFDILAWILFAEVSRRNGENPLRVFGLGVAFMFAGMALGNLVGNVLDTLIASGAVQITVVAMLSTLSLVVVAFMVIPEGVVAQLAQAVRPDKKDDPAENKTNENRPEEDEGMLRSLSIEAHCSGVAEQYGLTPRESEVIVLLAYGRTLSIIARDLQIAKGTARTHIENIYRKLDVHKQQELIDLVESHKI